MRTSGDHLLANLGIICGQENICGPTQELKAIESFRTDDAHGNGNASNEEFDWSNEEK